MLGSSLLYHLRRSGHHVVGMDRSRFDIMRDPVDQLPFVGIDCVVNASGVINRRIIAGENPESIARVNSRFPIELANTCERIGLPMIHISTDCVFDGGRGCHVETDATNAADDYGQSKALGEPTNCMVLRSSIIGPEQKNYYSLLCWFLQQKHTCQGFVDHQWNGITSLELARVVEFVVSGNQYAIGLRHVFGEDITKADLLMLLKDAFASPVTVIPKKTNQSRDMRLRTSWPDFSAKLGIRPIRDQIKNLVEVSDRKGVWRPFRELIV